MKNLLFVICLSLVSTMATAAAPNIVVIMADDLGYGDVSCNGATAVSTPHIDRLAAEGLRFNAGYCSASTCTPTRFSFITGTYAFRQAGSGVAPPNSPAIIQPGTETIASLLKRANYATAVVGKWHLGLGGPPHPDWNGDLNPGPLEIGFDHCLLLPTTNDRVPQVYVEDHRVRGLDPSDPLWVGDDAPPGEPSGITHRDSLRLNWRYGHNGTIHNGISRIGYYTGAKAARFRDEDLADMWVAESTKWIESHREQPFFLFFASHDIHVPRMPHERFQGQTSMGFRGDAIVEFDWSVGQIVAALEKNGLAENTLLVICSDNGPVINDGYEDASEEKLGSHRPAGPYSGGKYGITEGGTRTPFITYWPGRIKPGDSDAVVCTIDLAASCAALAGVDVPAGACRDSENVLPALLGDAPTGRKFLVQQDNGATKLGLRAGKWKLQSVPPRNAARQHQPKNRQYRLYDLAVDPGEKKNIADQHPDVTQDMIDKLNSIVGKKVPQQAPDRDADPARVEDGA